MRPELLRTFVRFLARVFVRIALELQDVQSLPPRYCQPTHFAATAGDVSIDHATFRRTLKIFKSFLQGSNFEFRAVILFFLGELTDGLGIVRQKHLNPRGAIKNAFTHLACTNFVLYEQEYNFFIIAGVNSVI